MNVYIIVGIIIIAVGTYFMYVGSGKSSAASHKEVLDKVEEFRQEMAEAKNSTSPDNQRIEKIENEFNSWANEFIKNKDLKKLALEKKGINAKGDRIALNDKWRPQFEIFFSSIRNIIDAYNKKTGDSITYNINKLPDNVFDPSTGKYEAKIIFRPDIKWFMTITPASPLDEDQMPKLRVNVTGSKEDSTLDIFTLSVINDTTFHRKPYILVAIHDNTRFDMKSIARDYEIQEGTFKGLAMDLIENQLLQL